MKKQILGFGLLISILFSATVFADEAFVGGTGGSVEVLSNEDVEMFSEIITIDVYSEGEEGSTVDIEVIYEFRNALADSISVEMGFPEFCNSECADFEDYKLRDFLTFQKINEEWEEIESTYTKTETKNWYLSTLTLEPGENIVKNTYSLTPTSYRKASRYWVEYILETGASWAGSISSADIIVNFHDGLSSYDLVELGPEGFIFSEDRKSVMWNLKKLEPSESENINIAYEDPNLASAGCSFVRSEDDVSSTEASSYYPSDGEFRYFPCKAYDRQSDTAWVEGVSGDGVGEWIELPLWGGKIYENLQLVNGYAADETLWEENNRIKALKLTFSNGYEETFELNDSSDVQSFVLGQKVSDVSWAKVEILEVYKGTKYEDTALSEIRLLGLPTATVDLGGKIDGKTYEDFIACRSGLGTSNSLGFDLEGSWEKYVACFEELEESEWHFACEALDNANHDRDECIAVLAKITGDLALCDEIVYESDVENYEQDEKNLCTGSVYLSDPKVCLSNSDSDDSDSCLKRYLVNSSQPDADLCRFIQSDWSLTECLSFYFEFLLENSNAYGHINVLDLAGSFILLLLLIAALVLKKSDARFSLFLKTAIFWVSLGFVFLPVLPRFMDGIAVRLRYLLNFNWEFFLVSDLVLVALIFFASRFIKSWKVLNLLMVSIFVATYIVSFLFKELSMAIGAGAGG